MLMIYSTYKNVEEILKMSKGYTIFIKTLFSPLKSIHLDYFAQSKTVLMVFTIQWCTGR